MSIKDFNDPDFIGNTGNYIYDNLTDRDNMIDVSKNLKAIIKYMKPDTYIKKCAKLMGTSIDDQLDAINEKIVDDLVNKLNSNTKLDLPYLDYKSKSQEGRHRALAIKKLGRSTLPVLIITKYDKKLHYSEVSNMNNIKKDINFAENILGFAENEKFDINKFKKDLSVNGWKTYKELNDSISDACTEYGKNEQADKPNETWVNKNHTKAVSFFNSLDEIATIDIHGPSIHDWDWVITDQPISLIKSISVTSESIRISRISKR